MLGFEEHGSWLLVVGIGEEFEVAELGFLLDWLFGGSSLRFGSVEVRSKGLWPLYWEAELTVPNKGTLVTDPVFGTVFSDPDFGTV